MDATSKREREKKVVADTLIRYHAHVHQHTFAHTHDGSTHTHTVTHSHDITIMWQMKDTGIITRVKSWSVWREQFTYEIANKAWKGQ